jgi:hypothetical protein
METANNATSNLTEIAFILDQSGSMESIKSGTLEGYNSFLLRQQEENAKYPVRFTLTLFNTGISEPIHSAVVSEAKPLDNTTYRPSGGTALLDAIGITVDGLGKRLAETPEQERPDKVIVAIMTDGEENSSRIFNWDQISAKIRHQTEVYKWEFLFLGANQDAIATAARMNIRAESSATYRNDDDSARTVLHAMSTSMAFSKRGLRESKRSLVELLGEEQAKTSGSKGK